MYDVVCKSKFILYAKTVERVAAFLSDEGNEDLWEHKVYRAAILNVHGKHWDKERHDKLSALADVRKIGKLITFSKKNLSDNEKKRLGKAYNAKTATAWHPHHMIKAATGAKHLNTIVPEVMQIFAELMDRMHRMQSDLNIDSMQLNDPSPGEPWAPGLEFGGLLESQVSNNYQVFPVIADSRPTSGRIQLPMHHPSLSGVESATTARKEQSRSAAALRSTATVTTQAPAAKSGRRGKPAPTTHKKPRALQRRRSPRHGTSK